MASGNSWVLATSLHTQLVHYCIHEPLECSLALSLTISAGGRKESQSCSTRARGTNCSRHTGQGAPIQSVETCEFRGHWSACIIHQQVQGCQYIDGKFPWDGLGEFFLFQCGEVVPPSQLVCRVPICRLPVSDSQNPKAILSLSTWWILSLTTWNAPLSHLNSTLSLFNHTTIHVKLNLLYSSNLPSSWC